jgi:hypothetical protein
LPPVSYRQMDVDAVKAGLQALATRHRFTLLRYGARQAQVLEIAGLLSAAQHYHLAGYGVTAENLDPGDVFKVKLSTSRYPRRYSYFSVQDEGIDRWEIFGNLPVLGNYTTDGASYVVDVGVARAGSVKEVKAWPGLPNSELVTFAEVKNLVVYPMLLAQFVGIVHEITPGFLRGRLPWGFKRDRHFMPALITVGYLHKTAARIVHQYPIRGYRVKVSFNLDDFVARRGWANSSVSPLV